MLFKTVNIIDKDLVDYPLYIVGEQHRDGQISYLKNFAVKVYPCWPCDAILEQSYNMWEAQLFVRKEDALKFIDERCGFRCNCGCINHVAKLWEVTRSNRTKEGVTYGLCDGQRENFDKDYFETVNDVKEIEIDS